MTRDNTPARGPDATVRATVQPSGLLSLLEPEPDTKRPHIYEIRLRHVLDTVASRTDLVYIGQGGPGRAAQLWKGGHSARVRLERARWAIGEAFEVEVRIWHTAHPELEEIRRLNAFVGRHGQLPVFNGRFEGWLPGRVLQEVARQLRASEPRLNVEQPLAYGGPLSRPPGRGPTFTGLDLYGVPPEGQRWRWLGTLLWVWPTEWLDEADQRRAQVAIEEGITPGAFVLVAVLDKDTPADRGWREVPELFHGRQGWTAGSRARVVHPGDPRLCGHPMEDDAAPPLTADALLGDGEAGALGPLAEDVADWLPHKGICG